MHYQQHAFEDVRAKGATRNFNTKPNEHMHKPLRDAYHQRTNFKEIENQILKVDHYLLVSTTIKQKLDNLDAFNAAKTKEDEEDYVAPDAETEGITTRRFRLGSPQKKISIFSFEVSHADDVAYRNFRKKLGEFLTDFLPAHSIPLPNGKRIQVHPGEKITEYRLLKVNYENMVTWKESTDYLRCTPNFHKRPRYDSVIVRTVSGDIFAHLICIISYPVDGKYYLIALIQPCDAPVGRLYVKDIDLRMTRVRAKPRAASELVSVHCIIRGAVLVPDYDKDGEFMVMDVLDADTFLRLRKMQMLEECP